MEVIKVEPDLDTESLNISPVYEDPLFDETEDRDQDPLVIKSAEVKQEVKVSILLVHALCKGFCKDRFSLGQVTVITKFTFYCYLLILLILHCLICVNVVILCIDNTLLFFLYSRKNRVMWLLSRRNLQMK